MTLDVKELPDEEFMEGVHEAIEGAQLLFVCAARDDGEKFVQCAHGSTIDLCISIAHAVEKLDITTLLLKTIKENMNQKGE